MQERHIKMKDGAASLFHLKNMRDMIPKLFVVSDITLQVQCPAKEIEHSKEILPEADLYEQYLDPDIIYFY